MRAAVRGAVRGVTLLGLAGLASGCGSPASGTWPGAAPQGTAADPVPTEHCGVLEADETWDRSGAPHLVTCDLILRGATLTIEADSVVALAPGASLVVEDGGHLHLDGDACCAISLEPASEDPWGGLRLEGGSLEASWVILRGAGSSERAALDLVAGSAELRNLAVEGSDGCGLSVGAGVGLAASGALSVEGASWPVCIAGPGLADIGAFDLKLEDNDTQALRQDGGLISADEAWPALPLPVRLLGSLEVRGASLAVAAGTTFEGVAGGSLSVSDGGQLVLEGDEDRPIRLSPAPGQATWSGLSAASASLSLAHVQLTSAGEADGAALLAVGADVSLFEVTIMGGLGAGVVLDGGSTLTQEGGLSIRGVALVPLTLAATQADQLDAAGLDLSGNGVDAIELSSDETLTGAASWGAAGVPYRLTGDLVLAGSEASPAGLELQAGVELALAPGAALRVGELGPAALRLEGTDDAPVLLRPWQDEGAGSWAGVLIGAQAVDVETTLVGFELHAGGGAPLLGAIEIRGASPTLQSGLIADSAAYGLYMDADAAPTIEDLVFEDNALGDSNR